MQEPPEPGSDAGENTGEPSGSSDPGAVYFREPEQLLSLLREAEGQAAAAQEAAHAALQRRDEARSASGAAGAGLDAEVARLRGEVEGLQAGLHRARSAQHAPLPPAGGEAEEAGRGLPRELLPQLRRTYQELCAGAEGAGADGGEGLAPLRMLGALEARLEEGLAAVDRGGLHVALARVERAREKQRRQAARDRELAAREENRVSLGKRLPQPPQLPSACQQPPRRKTRLPSSQVHRLTDLLRCVPAPGEARGGAGAGPGRRPAPLTSPPLRACVVERSCKGE